MQVACSEFWSEFLTAFRNVVRQYRRSLFGISAVAFGVIALLLTAGFVEWIFWAAREGTIEEGLGHIHIMRPGYLEHGQADPYKYLMPEKSAEISAIERLSAVRTAAPRVGFTGLISHDETTLSFIGEGVDAKRERVLSPSLLISSGSNLAPENSKGILLGRGLAENLGAEVGDTVVLMATTPSGGTNAVEANVRGLFSTVSKAYDDSALRVPLPLAQQLLRISGVHLSILVLDDTAHTTDVLMKLRSDFKDSGIRFVPWYDLADFYNKTVTLMSQQVMVVELIIAIVIVLGISNTMTMNVLERTSEIGTCLAIGCRRLQILRQFLYEGLTIGLIGGTLGVALAWLLAALISTVGIPMPPPPGMSQGYNGEIMLTSRLAVEAFVLALATTLLASVYPAWRASRMQIVDALRHQR
ncbi:MAG: FtsX-like permease family protein [Candidatus Accumulibacter necessarius]|uniref:ABC transporter permease n=1 Tax=Candidatus Accumulibacter necessarius TaxID=2954386 RepID=UPI002FC3703A